MITYDLTTATTKLMLSGGSAVKASVKNVAFPRLYAPESGLLSEKDRDDAGQAPMGSRMHDRRLNRPSDGFASVQFRVTGQIMKRST